MARIMDKQDETRRDRDVNQGERSQSVETTHGRESGESRSLATRGQVLPSLWTESPFSLMNYFADEMDRVFGNFGMGSPGVYGSRRGTLTRGRTGDDRLWSPPVEVLERGQQIIVRADLPGLKRENIRVDLSNDILTLEGERRQEKEVDEKGFYRSERRYGMFSRSFALPPGVNPDDVQAVFRDGVLEVTIPVPSQHQRGRQIEIQSGEGSSGGARTM